MRLYCSFPAVFLNFFLLLFFGSNSVVAFADNFAHRADSHAPIGVKGDHTHHAQEWMVAYRYMSMKMKGSLEGSSSVSEQEILGDYMVAPKEMTKEIHMAGVMYAPVDELTLMAMLPYIDQEMRALTRMGMSFKTRSSGIGDAKVAGLFNLIRNSDSRLIINAGVSLPTGEIDSRDDTPGAKDMKLPYGMQLGSGTYDLLPGITYAAQYASWSWGTQANATLRTGRNSNHYTLGDRFETSAWTSYLLDDSLSVSARTIWDIWGNINGADPELNSQMSPGADPKLRAGQKVSLGIGANYYITEGPAQSLRLATELLLPVYQDLDGPQLENKWALVAGTQYSF